MSAVLVVLAVGTGVVVVVVAAAVVLVVLIVAASMRGRGKRAAELRAEARLPVDQGQGGVAQAGDGEDLDRGQRPG